MKYSLLYCRCDSPAQKQAKKKSRVTRGVLQHLGGMKVVNPELSRTLMVIPHSDFYDDHLPSLSSFQIETMPGKCTRNKKRTHGFPDKKLLIYRSYLLQ